MTRLEVMEFLDNINVGYTWDEKYNEINLCAQEHMRVDGYLGFSVTFAFNDDDSFFKIFIGEG